MLSTTEHARRTAAKAVVAAVAGALAMGIALPAAANAAPITIIPGLPPVEIPGVPAPPKPKPNKPKPQVNQAPGVPAMPAVASRTGWVALADDNTHTIFWWHNGTYNRQMPISMGTNKHPTPNGTYYTKEKHRMIIMDSSTYGVAVNSPEGYKTPVDFATRMSWDGIFIHAAPWSVAQQGRSNASHGCINISEANGKWVFDNIPRGTPIVVRGTVGGGNWRTPRD
ncbi:L,D-transpeptidase [Gordonia sp. X0973]|uniref:L,D-transpeptidase n=1 Tax=Gordonia sp. X0973 TaxID=2742602 RepID=UPI000F53F6C2|nr:L,D-transpeptidase [Gordonia sp. X0973]QKT06995.1 L,D-transpeptidase [Gordonia sp. X0973]